MKQIIFSKPFQFVIIGALIGILGVMPMAANLITQVLAANNKALPFPIPVVLVIQFFQSCVMVTSLALIGFWLNEKIQLGTPLLNKFVDKKLPLKSLKYFVLIGFITGFLLIAFSHLLDKYTGALHSDIEEIAWQGILASFYGGFCEEIICRLFLVSLLVWLLQKLKINRTLSFYFAIIFAALLFGIGHLPAAKSIITNYSNIIAIRLVLLNAFAGVVFGFMYWRYCLLAAIVAHFSADLILHVLTPLVS